LTTDAGNYEVSLRAVGSGIQDAAANSLAVGNFATWRVLIPGDVSADNRVGLRDLGRLGRNLGLPSPTPEQGDLNRDNAVNRADMVALLGYYGSVLPPLGSGTGVNSAAITEQVAASDAETIVVAGPTSIIVEPGPIMEPAPSAVTIPFTLPSSSIIHVVASTESGVANAHALAVPEPLRIYVAAAPLTRPARSATESAFLDRDFRPSNTVGRPVPASKFAGRFLQPVALSGHPATALLAYLSDLEDRSVNDSNALLTHPRRDPTLDRVATDAAFADLDALALSARCGIGLSSLRKVRPQ
jgi:hypothetical protein